MDCAASLEALCRVGPSHCVAFLWEFRGSEGDSGYKRSGLLMSLERVYIQLLTVEQEALPHDMVCVLQFAIKRTRSFVVACMVQGMRYFSRREESAQGRRNAELVEEQFDGFMDWAISLAEQCTSRQNDMQRDMVAGGVDKLIADWKACCDVDGMRLEFAEEALRGTGGQLSDSADEVDANAGPPRAAGALTPGDRDNIRCIKDVMSDYADGFIFMCLRHYQGNVEQVLNALLEGILPDSLASLDKTLTLEKAVRELENEMSCYGEAEKKKTPEGPMVEKEKKVFYLEADGHVGEAYSPDPGQLSAQEKRLIVEMGKEQCDIYDDELDDTFEESFLKAPPDTLHSAPESSEEEEESDSAEQPSLSLAGSQFGSLGRGRGRPEGRVVAGQSLQARRKEQNKSRVGNHNRRRGHLAKMRRGMIF
eukprot:GHVS01064745.1.p1 GENE.GHVS01064745.1~~GHVS01064745.1.p1  ORF type:complete len:422 (+),score=61.27 GHVS01064745.1:1139-2404(+)